MKSLKIVIADNESVIRMDVREMLEEAGHEVVGEAVNGKKLWSWLVATSLICAFLM